MFAKIKEFFNREPVNTGRQRNIDLFKALSIFCMVMCHVVMFTSSEYGFGYEFADVWLGSVTGVAHGFMLCMGVGMAFTHKNSPKDFILRGITLLVLAYVLNMLRGGLLCLILGAETQKTVSYILLNDILQFAAIANIAVGLLKALKFKNINIFLVGLVLSIVATFIPAVDFGNYYANDFIGFFIPTVGYGATFAEEGALSTISTFSFINWFVFVGAGLVLGDIIQRVKNLDKMYKWFAIIGGIVSLVYLVPFIIIKNTTGIYYYNINSLNIELSSEVGYYALGFVDFIGLLAVDLFWLGVFHFVGKKYRFPFLTMTANNITTLYIIHWVFVGAMTLLLPAVPIWVNYLIGLVTYVVSAFLSIPVTKLIKFIKGKFRRK